MKKIIGLVCLLAVVVALVVPMAASAAIPSTGVTGATTLPGITVTAPVAFGFGTFVLGDNYKAAANGSIVVTIGSSLQGNWQVIADSAVGYMKTTDNVGLQEWQLCAETTSGPWYTADGNAHKVNGVNYAAQNLVYSGTATGTLGAKVTTPLKFAVYQPIIAQDVATAKTYSITYTFTGSVTP